MKEIQRNLVAFFSEILEENKGLILNNWLKLIRKESIAKDEQEFLVFKKAFEQLVDDFTTFIPRRDFKGYYSSNREVARIIARNDISYEKFIFAFHLFEESYIPLLVNINPKELAAYLIAIDHLHHNTISIVSKEYFALRDATIVAMVKLIELRDVETGAHIERVRDFSMLLAKELGLSEKFLAQLEKASLLHDIGKIGIRDSILLKPGILTNEEFEEVKKHTTAGAKIIEKVIAEQCVVDGYLLMAKEIALFHHERYDGSGYPKGLKACEVPICARILALADAYDTIVSQRSYKPSFSHEEAVERIKRDSGKHFDPEIVEIFIKINGKFKEVARKWV